MKSRIAILPMSRLSLRFATFATFFALVPFSICGFAQTEEPTSDAFAEILKEEAGDLPDESIQEILEIRQRLGGGTGLGLDGILNDSINSSDRAKENNTAETTTSIEPRRSIENSPFPYEFASPNLACCESERLFFELLISNSPQTTNVQPAQNHQQSVAKLREVVRQMEQLAADLEEMELYSDADVIRERATGIRMQARRTAQSAQDRGDLKTR